LKPPEIAPLSKADLLEKMVNNRPEIQTAANQAKASDNLHTLAMMSLLPDFQVFAGTSYYNALSASPYAGASNLQHTFMVGVQINVPLWAFFNERQSIRAASHDKAAAEAVLDSVTLQSKVALEGALANFESSRAKLETYKEHLLPLSEQTLKLAVINYSSGKIDFQTLADATSVWRSTRRDFYSNVVGYCTAYFTLGQLIGEDL
jgi:outer membrane protein TolC